MSAPTEATEPTDLRSGTPSGAVVDCGWGRLVFGHRFETSDELLTALADERPGRRDICIYVPDPHVLVAAAPHELFIDPSLTFRLDLTRTDADQGPAPPAAVTVRPLEHHRDAEDLNRIYAACDMVSADPAVVVANSRTATFTHLLAEDHHGRVVGTVTGVDHVAAFDDAEAGTSLWCLAVDPQCKIPGVGVALVRALAERYRLAGRAHLDLSVMHDNAPAIALYERLGFERVPVFCVKRKNPINEPLFAAPETKADGDLNPYARIIADEARRRGIAVDVLDAESGELRLVHGGRSVVTRESLSELTSAVAMSRCDDKAATRRLLARVGLRIAEGRLATGDHRDAAFLAEMGELVVKPVSGEQGRGVTVGVTTPDELEAAVADASNDGGAVLLERRHLGQDLRLVVIDHEVVAASVRRPPTVVGTGRHSVRDLIERQSRRRAAATGGESTIPIDPLTETTVARSGHALDEVLAEGEEVLVRSTANLHTGGTIHDVTDALHPALRHAAVAASEALDIPVTGIDMIVASPERPEHVIIEANERPGLANHEPQPTAERFVDLLFPSTRALPSGWPTEDRGRGRDHRVVADDPQAMVS